MLNFYINIFELILNKMIYKNKIFIFTFNNNLKKEKQLIYF